MEACVNPLHIPSKGVTRLRLNTWNQKVVTFMYKNTKTEIGSIEM